MLKISKYFFSILMLSLALISFVFGLVLGIYYDPQWFGSLGSIVVLFGAISEYRLIRNEFNDLYGSLKGEGAAQAGDPGIPDLTPKGMHKILSNLSHIIIIFGTLIWGFGENFLSIWVY